MAVAATSKISLQKFEKEENVAMCKLWDEVREDGFIEGEALGEARGEARGETNGEAKGIVRMGEEFGLSKEQIIEKIAGNLNIEVAAAEKYYEMFSMQG
jgi:predicted transposase YdaD